MIIEKGDEVCELIFLGPGEWTMGSILSTIVDGSGESSLGDDLPAYDTGVTDGEKVSGSVIGATLDCGLPTAGREALNLEAFESILGGGKGSAR